MTMQKTAPTACAEVPSCDTHTNQGPSASSRPSHPQKKGKDKKIFSCHSCRRRKLKCDRFDPCGACQARGEGHLCTWEEGQRPERNNRESLEQLPKLILSLTEEVKELKTSTSALIEKVRCKEGATSTDGLAENVSLMPDVTPCYGGSGTRSVGCSSWGLDSPCRKLDPKRWTPSRIAALLPESTLLHGLISHYIHTSASLSGFIDVHQLVSDLEEVAQVRQGSDYDSVHCSLEHFDIKVSLILACASLAALDLDPAKAEELGLGSVNLDAFVQDLWRRARILIAPLDVDSFATGGTALSMSTVAGDPPSLADSDVDFLQQTGSPPTTVSNVLLRVVAIKILLLLAARSFAAPSEYLKLHLDVVSAAVEASLDSTCDEAIPLTEQEWRWQLWSFVCVLDWTSPGIYHNNSYFIRQEMHRDPPSKVPGIPDDGIYPSTIERDHWERLSQTRYYLEYALALAHVSRRAEDCIIHPGPIPPAQAAELCAELDVLDNKLSFYQLLGGTAIQGNGNSYNSGVSLSAPPRGGGGGGGGGDGGRVNVGGSSIYSADEHRISIQRAPKVQNMHLRLDVGLIRFKLFRHEAFHLMHDVTTSSPLRMMCMDACMDACILVLSLCRNIGNRCLDDDGIRNMVTDMKNEEKCLCTGTLRRVLQPASSAALVGQVLLHASQSADGLDLPIPDKHTSISGPRSTANPTTDFFSFAGASVESYAPYHLGNVNGLTSRSERLSPEKVRLLRWHINTVISLLEGLQATSPLARYKLGLHRQCM